MPDASQAKTLMEFIVSTYGQVSLLLMAACGYFGWALKQEQNAHQRTRDLAAGTQDQIVKMQIQYVQVLSELKLIIETRMGK